MDMKIKRGQILRQLRLLRQLTQNEAAENFGISQQTYQKYESGKTEPPYDLLCDFATFYGVSTDYLLGRDTGEPKTLDKLVSEFNVSALEKEILDNYLSLPKDMRSDLMEFLQKSVKKVVEKSESVQSNAQKQRHIDRLGDIEDELEQERQARAKDVI